VNDIDLLTRAVENDPRNTILHAMLVDALIDQRDMLRSEADAHVRRVVAVAADARDLADAAQLMGAHDWLSRELRAAVLACVDLHNPGRACVLLVSGDDDPTECEMSQLGPSNRYWNELVIVGARWILTAAETLRVRRRMNRIRRAELRHAK